MKSVSVCGLAKLRTNEKNINNVMVTMGDEIADMYFGNLYDINTEPLHLKNGVLTLKVNGFVTVNHKRDIADMDFGELYDIEW